MPSVIWNPFFGHYIPTHQTKSTSNIQDIVLDLSTEKRSQDETPDLVKKEPFDFNKFYKTYQQIASREPIASRNRKRRLSSGGSSSDSDKAIIQETKKQRTENFLMNNCFNSNRVLKEQSSIQQEHFSKSARGKKDQKIASIRDSCDCRFCYEDHIIKMRLKRSKPWLNM